MTILQLAAVKIGQAGVQPATFKMVSTDSLAKITSRNYIKQGTSGSVFNKNDLIETIYNYGKPDAANATLYVTVEQGTNIITLNEELPAGFGEAALKSVTNNAQNNVASTSGVFTVDTLLAAADTSGTVKTSGIPLTNVQLVSGVKVGRTSDIGGGGAGPINVSVTGLTTNSVVVASIESSSNTVAISKCDGVVNGFNVTFTADPGASCILSYVAYIATQ